MVICLIDVVSLFLSLSELHKGWQKPRQRHKMSFVVTCRLRRPSTFSVGGDGGWLLSCTGHRCWMTTLVYCWDEYLGICTPPLSQCPYPGCLLVQCEGYSLDYSGDTSWESSKKRLTHSTLVQTWFLYPLPVFICLQGLNRLGKDSQFKRDGVLRKDWHDYEAIKRDSSQTGRSRTVTSLKYRWSLHIQRTQSIVMHTKDLHMLRITSIPSPGVL